MKRLICMAMMLAANLSWFIQSPALSAEVERTKTRPNILFAFADDWGRYASAYAKLEPGGISDLVNTPNFDRVAAEGVLFKNAFVNAPSCTPCRSSLLSGQHFWRTGLGAILQGAIWDSSIPSYPLILEENGYHIGHTYKVWSPGRPVDAPYGGRARSYMKRGRRFNAFSQTVSAANDPDAARAALYEEVRGNFRDFLAARGAKDKPFAYWFGPTNTHRKWTQGSGKALWGIDPDGLIGKVPGFLPDVPIVREDIADYLGEAQAFDTALGVLLEELDRIGELDNTLIAVSGDHGIPGFPRGKCNLYDFGVAVPLAICWAGHIPAGRVLDDFVCLPDLAPTFLEAAGLAPPNTMTARSLVPILASEKSGLVDPRRSAVVVGRERHVAAARTNRLPYPQRAIRTKDFLFVRNFMPDRWPMGTGPLWDERKDKMPSFEKLREDTFAAFADLDASPTKAWVALHTDQPNAREYFDFAFGRRPAEELYDLRSDPHQMNNVASDPKYTDVKDRLSRRLMKILTETNDPRVIGDGTSFDKPPFVEPQK